MKILTRILVVALLPACWACTGNPEIDLQGTWHGQWTAGGIAGSLEVTFAGKRAFGDLTLYDVTLVLTGPSCPGGQDHGTGDRTVAFNQNDVHFAVSIGAAAGSEGVFLFDGAMNGGREIDGSYRLTSDSCPACTCGLGTSGTWTALR
jgi:hypothetical protein